MEISGVGTFKEGSGFWEAEPDALGGATLSIKAPAITSDHVTRAKAVCAEWSSILSGCKRFIESNRQNYQLHAKTFSNPNVFVENGSTWAIYFDTELETEAVVGVEFSDESPNQLIIGD